MPTKSTIPRWLKELHPWIDASEASEGYTAVAKGTPDGKNICSHCDYRPECLKLTVNVCGSHKREDNMSVMFEKKETK
jgi:hypothetical protein